MMLAPELRKKIVDLAKNGTRPALIQGMLPVHVPLSDIYREIRVVGNVISANGRARLIVLEPDIHALLKEQADLRRIEPRELARRLLTIVAEEDLVGAILDDGVSA